MDDKDAWMDTVKADVASSGGRGRTIYLHPYITAIAPWRPDTEVDAAVCGSTANRCNYGKHLYRLAVAYISTTALMLYAV
jgi:hypothetical protein